MQHLQPKTTLKGGQYRIERVLGQGGFGNTYRGINTTFDDKVAIKEFFMQGINGRDDTTGAISVSLESNRNQFEEQLEKFKKEALRIRKLDNPHIVKAHDLFEENGTAYYVMDYVDGENLAERLKRTGKPMTEKEIREFLPQILDALKTVHDAGIWHLDLKPANIMLTKEGKVKLIDFGASKQLNTQKGGATTSTAISYTNGYAPREQMEQNYDKFGPWTDIYALGATLYALLTNKRPPLPTDIDDDASEDKHNSLPLPESTSEEMKSLILWMMQTNRNQRPHDVDSIITHKCCPNSIISEDDIDEGTFVEECPKKNDNRKSTIESSTEKRKYLYYICIPIAIILLLCIGLTIWNTNERMRYKPKYRILSEKDKTCELLGSTPKEDRLLSLDLLYGGRDSIACIPNDANGIYNIPQNVDGFKVVKLGDYSFMRTKLSSVNVPKGVKAIGAYAFSYCKNMVSVNISDGVGSIGKGCFKDCKKLTKIELPESITNIGLWAFEGCSSLNQIQLPPLLTEISENLFMRTGLTSIKLPEGVEVISKSAFHGCLSLSSVSLPSTIKSIKEDAFGDCKMLSSIIIPEGIEEISLCAFYYTSLESLHLPKTIKIIKGEFHTNNGRLKSVISDIPDPTAINFMDRSGTPYYLKIDGPEEIVLYVPHGTKDLYIKAGWAEHFSKIIER